MRQHMDCAILEFNNQGIPGNQTVAVHADGRLHIHSIRIPASWPAAPNVLETMALMLRRFDAVLLKVDLNNLSWTRQALMQVQSIWQVPVICLVDTLKAAAIKDLYRVGMDDFIRAPICLEELRVRMDKLAGKHSIKPRSEIEYDSLSEEVISVSDSLISVSSTSNFNVAADNLDDHLNAFAIASASSCANSSESFGSAKGKIVHSFERAYIIASLTKSSGNIALAARSAKKHRRAYWALMQKHKINADAFRVNNSRDHKLEGG